MESETITSDVAFAAAPVEVCCCTVIVPEVTPAVIVCAPSVNASLEATATTVSVAVSVLPETVAVTVCAPVDVTVQEAVALLHDPLGEIANVVDAVASPRLLLS